MWLKYLCIPKLDNWVELTLYLACDYLSMQGLKLIGVSKRGSRQYYNFLEYIGLLWQDKHFYWISFGLVISSWIFCHSLCDAWSNTDPVNILRPGQIVSNFAGDIFKWVFLDENGWKSFGWNVFLGLYFAVLLNIGSCYGLLPSNYNKPLQCCI